MSAIYPLRPDDELHALGALTAEFGGELLALQVSRSGVRDKKTEFLRRLRASAQDRQLARAADSLLGVEEQREASGFSVLRACRTMLEENSRNGRLEADVSALVANRTGTVPNGVWLPLQIAARSLESRDFNLGSATQAGALIGAARDAAGSLTADPLRRCSVAAALGATLITGLRDPMNLPAFSSSTSLTWPGEIGAATSIAETTGGHDLTPVRCAATLTLSRQAVIAAQPQVDAVIARHLTQACFEQLEVGIFTGDGTSNAPTGIRATAGVNSVAGGTDGATLTWAHLADLEAAPGLANAPVTELSGWALNPATAKFLRKTLRSTYLGHMWEGGDRPLMQHRAGITACLPSNLSKGASGNVCSALVYSTDWSSLVLGIYGAGIDLTIDKVTLASVGQVRITAALHAGMTVIRPAAFAVMEDAKLT